MNGAETIQAAFGSELIATGSSGFSIVYLPEGTHEIEATVNGKAQKRTVTVDERVLASFQDDLAKRLSDNVRPFAGFDHKAGPASMIPTGYRYEKGVGLILEGELTQAGKEAIDGRNYSYWSPSYLMSKGVPVGLTPTGEIGSFVNDPAFRSIERIAASHTETTMEITEILTELGLAESNQTAEEAVAAAKTSLATLRESASTVESVTAARASELEAVNAAKAEAARIAGELETVKASLKMLEDEKAEQVKAANAEIVQAAVNRGAIPPQDDATKAFWLKSLSIDPESTKAALSALPSKDAASGQSVAAEVVKDGAAPTEITRAEFDAMSPVERNKYMRSGGKIAKDDAK
jgi:hypothetical protein